MHRTPEAVLALYLSSIGAQALVWQRFPAECFLIGQATDECKWSNNQRSAPCCLLEALRGQQWTISGQRLSLLCYAFSTHPARLCLARQP